jgi:hypothetical protein
MLKSSRHIYCIGSGIAPKGAVVPKRMLTQQLKTWTEHKFDGLLYNYTIPYAKTDGFPQDYDHLGYDISRPINISENHDTSMYTYPEDEKSGFSGLLQRSQSAFSV